MAAVFGSHSQLDSSGPFPDLCYALPASSLNSDSALPFACVDLLNRLCAVIRISVPLCYTLSDFW